MMLNVKKINYRTNLIETKTLCSYAKLKKVEYHIFFDFFVILNVQT